MSCLKEKFIVEVLTFVSGVEVACCVRICTAGGLEHLVVVVENQQRNNQTSVCHGLFLCLQPSLYFLFVHVRQKTKTDVRRIAH